MSRQRYADQAQPQDWRGEYTMLGLAGAAVAVFYGAWAAMWGGGRMVGQVVPANPVTAFTGLATGTLAWPGLAADFVAAVEVLFVSLAVWVVWRWRHPAPRRRTEADPLARHLARAGDLRPYTAEGAARKASRLRAGGVADRRAEHGMFLGETLTYPVTPIMASWEDTVVLISGPRIGKTSAFVIRQVIEAPGPALVTTVRRDVWDATAGPRSQRGRLWNFDLQARVGDGVAPWWVDLLEGLRDLEDATRLMQVFADASRPTQTGSRNDYFDSEGQFVVSAMLLAAALKPGGSFHDVHRWLSNPNLPEPGTILRQHHHTYVADHLDEDRTMSSKPQQDGVFGFARSLMSSLLIPRVLRWVAPDVRTGPDGEFIVDDHRPRFSPDEFVTSTDTLYLHSKKGSRATPFIAALTQAVLDAGERRAQQMGGRLDPPLLNILDEAANICPLRSMPDEFSTFGGFGMPTLCVLQSFEQGIEVWGRGGMRKLWNASTIRLYGGGCADPEFLGMLSKLLGSRDRTVTGSSSTQQGGLTTSYSTRRDEVAEIADLGALPPGRALMYASGTRPTMLQTVPWWETGWAPVIRRSIAAHAPHHPNSAGHYARATDADPDLDSDLEQPDPSGGEPA